MKLSIIAALTDDGVIGFENRLPWHLPEDLKRFKKLTLGHPVIMGRRTFDSLGKPLPGRTNIVLTRNRAFRGDGILTAAGLEEAIATARTPRAECDPAEIFVIGGAEIFRQAIPRADRLYLTLIHRPFAGDVHFPEADLARGYREVERFDGVSEKNPDLPYSFLTLDRLVMG
jgi:dihydrofolate reductase